MSLDNLPFSRNNIAAFKASIFPCLMLFSSKADGIEIPPKVIYMITKRYIVIARHTVLHQWSKLGSF